LRLPLYKVARTWLHGVAAAQTAMKAAARSAAHHDRGIAHDLAGRMGGQADASRFSTQNGHLPASDPVAIYDPLRCKKIDGR